VFSLGGNEFLIIVVVALLLFGPDKIPQLARTVGRFTREFNKYKGIMESTIRMEISQAEGPTVDEVTVEERIAKAGAASQALIDADKSAAPDAGANDAPAPDAGADAGADGRACAPETPSPVPPAAAADEEDEG
jgi:TatA/E family protein of Tat protein translocase